MVQVIRNEYVTNVPVRVLGDTGPERMQITGLFAASDSLIVSSSVPLLPGTWSALAKGHDSRGVEGVAPNPAIGGAEAGISAPAGSRSPRRDPWRRPANQPKPATAPAQNRVRPVLSPPDSRSITDSASRMDQLSDAARVSGGCRSLRTSSVRHRSVESVKAIPMVNYIRVSCSSCCSSWACAIRPRSARTSPVAAVDLRPGLAVPGRRRLVVDPAGRPVGEGGRLSPGQVSLDQGPGPVHDHSLDRPAPDGRYPRAGGEYPQAAGHHPRQRAGDDRRRALLPGR